MSTGLERFARMNINIKNKIFSGVRLPQSFQSSLALADTLYLRSQKASARMSYNEVIILFNYQV